LCGLVVEQNVNNYDVPIVVEQATESGETVRKVFEVTKYALIHTQSLTSLTHSTNVR
jgi:NACalpha-BTF3-like transcription factor